MPESPRLTGSGVLKLTIFCNGSEIDGAYKIISVSVLKAVNRIPKAKIIISDGDAAKGDFPISNSDDFKPGAQIEIKAGYNSKADTIFKGIVIRHGIKISERNSPSLVVECSDEAVKMTAGRKNANYVDKKDSEIISAIIGKYQDLSASVDATDTKYKELVQYYCTDWDYIISRGDVNGLITIVDDSSVSVKKPQTDGSAKLKVSYGQDIINFNAEIDALNQFASVKSVSWNLKDQAPAEQKGKAPSLNKQGNITPKDLAKVIGLDSLNLQTAAPLEETGLKAWASAQLLKSGLASIKGSMSFQGNSLAKPGEIIEIDRVGDRFNGNIFVSAVYHNISEGNWITEAEFGLDSGWFAEKKDITAPPASGFLPGIEGLHVGIVKKLDDDPEKENKIQVTVPVMQAETEGVWARLANFYGTNGFGSFFIPEVGDEVVLGYFNNDPCHPVILGSLYSSKNPPPYKLTPENFIKAIITKTGIKIEFDDENKILTLETPGKNSITINDKAKSILIADQNKNKTELNSSGITLDSPKDITITSKGKVDITGTGGVNLTSNADVKISGLNVNAEGKVGFTGKGSATAEVSASGTTTIKGGMVMIN
jgi:Rhs element Vgr protein